MINASYALLCRIPLFIDEDGHYWAEELWGKDLNLHFGYIRKFTICCPVEPLASPIGKTRVLSNAEFKVSKLRADVGILSVLLNFFPNWYVVLSACRKNDIIHSDGAGWAFPLTFYVLPISYILKFQWVIVIESSFWLPPQGAKMSVRQLISKCLHLGVLSRSLRRAKARIFTQTFYRDMFLGADHTRSLIAPACWVDSSQVVERSCVEQRAAVLSRSRLSVVYPSRLIEAKGAHLLLDALKIISQHNPPIDIVVIGDGSLAEDFKSAASEFGEGLRVYMKPSIPYGKLFFEEISRHHYLLVANIADEQPRIIFDSFSQAVPVIAPNTAGVKDIVNQNCAILFDRGSSESLANALLNLVEMKAISFSMGLAGLDTLGARTHESMHEVRRVFLEQVLAEIN